MAEIDYMVLDKAGVDAEINVIDDLTSGAYDMPDLELDDIRSARHLVARHRDLKIGLTDAVNAVLAERFGTNEMLTNRSTAFPCHHALTRRFTTFRFLPFDL
jgi:predicted nucleic acid-binding protein